MPVELRFGCEGKAADVVPFCATAITGVVTLLSCSSPLRGGLEQCFPHGKDPGEPGVAEVRWGQALSPTYGVRPVPSWQSCCWALGLAKTSE